MEFPKYENNDAPIAIVGLEDDNMGTEEYVE